jgi:thioredoxin-related protein
MRRFTLTLLTLTIMLHGCGQSRSPDQGETTTETTAGTEVQPTAEEKPTGIAWHKGDIEAAFELARKENKPVFLYWGAEWCPPCHQINATIFNRREFIDRSRLFVPVYLDGDTENAQKLGERFGVMGYPTMIVLNPEGDEITRIPGGINIELYGSVLDLALADARPVQEVLAAFEAGEALSDSDWRLLAYYSWFQDNQRVLGDADQPALFRGLVDACPESLIAECSRLYMQYLDVTLAAARDEEHATTLTPEQKQEAVDRLEQILGDYDLVMANLLSVIFNGGDFTAAVTDDGSAERAALETRWLATLDRIQADADVSTMERLYTCYGKLNFERMHDPEAPVSEQLKAEIGDRVAWAEARASSYERVPVINAAWNTLYEAGMDEMADELLAVEIERSETPYYFMLNLAETAKRAGRTEEAIAWLKRAYEESVGPATRFQWGYAYLVGLIEMAPEDAGRIESETLRVFGELANVENAFYQRTRVRLGRLDQQFREWNEDGQHADTIRSIRNGVLEVCSRIPADDAGRATCESFLKES